MIRFDQEVCADLAQASSREWLETNGLGGFASSTLSGLNTRRYHGLLVAATRPPAGRDLLLSKLEETLILDGRRVELSSNQYPGVVHPQGYSFLKGFRLDPYPIFTFESEGVVLEKHVCMLHGENTAVISYRLVSPVEGLAQLELLPLIAFRDYHSITHENGELNPTLQQALGRASITPYVGLPTLHFAHNAAALNVVSDWYHSFQFMREQERGLDFQEDLFNPCCFHFALSATQPAVVIASTEVRDAGQAESLVADEVRRRLTLGPASNDSDLCRELMRAADQFIVRRDQQKTIIAGYHWFGDWGRDTMIALNGLTLATGRAADAKDILLEFAKYVDQGMLPNRFPEDGEALEYNTADATLWYFEAIRAYHAQTADHQLLQQLFPALVDIIDWHVRGTRYGIRVEDNGLLHAGEPGVQLTWMDAKIGDWVVTPRIGKPVEIQALWYNALRVMEDFAGHLQDQARQKHFAQMAALAARSFNGLFWNKDDSCLLDVVDEDTFDASLRPNQIFAVSLHHSMLSDERARKVVNAVQSELLTPVGLRTLSPSDSRYVGTYNGDQRSRDTAYHQGTVWPWLMGPFVEAYLKVHRADANARNQAADWLEGFRMHLSEAGLGTISEIMEGDAPHRPCGCVAQAWSVAEILRALALVKAQP